MYLLQMPLVFKAACRSRLATIAIFATEMTETEVRTIPLSVLSDL
jgi:hypothetical protein